MNGRTLGLVGFGRIPQMLAQKAQAIGLNVIAYDLFIPTSVASNLNVRLIPLNDLSAQADFISVHTPLTEENEV